MSLNRSKKEDQAAYYAINNDPRYVSFTKTSVETLRKFNKDLKVYLFVYGELEDSDRSFFRKNNIIVAVKGGVQPEHVTSLKWFSLQYLARSTVKRLIYIDGDTIFSGKVDILFERHDVFDFYARIEVGTEKDRGDYYIGKSLIRAQLNHDAYQQITKQLKAVNVPVFNTGVMLFNHSSFKKIAQRLVFYKSVLRRFQKKSLPYPCLNSHLIDEITASITFGKVRGFTYGVLDKKIAPCYLEFKEKAVKTPGTVMHIWTCLYGEYAGSRLGISDK